MKVLRQFEEYLEEGIVKKQTPDKLRASNLIKESERKTNSLKLVLNKIGLSNDNANDIIEYCYDIIINLIRARMLIEGYSSSGLGAHEAEVSYLRKLNFSESAVQFANQLRYFRNGILYYRKRFDKEYADKVIDFLEIFKEKLKPFFIIIRWPLGIGKSTIAKALAKSINGEYIAYDRILEEYDLTKDKEQGYISQKSFFKANEIASKRAKKLLYGRKSVVFDGNFYWKSQIDDLISKLNYKNYVFTLKAPLKICIERDAKRKKKYGKDAVEAVYKKSTSFDYGEIIDTENKTVEEVVEEIKKRLRWNRK